jgi:hypothetical protein
MHYTSHEVTTSKAIAEVQRMTEHRKKPDHEDYKNQLKMAQLETFSNSSTEGLEELILEWSRSTQPKQKTLQEANLKHWQQVIYNLSKATASNQWLGIDGDVAKYTGGQMMGLAYRNLNRVLDELEARGWITKEQGKPFQNRPRVNHYYPEYELRRQLVPFSLLMDNSSSFTGSYLRINNPELQYAGFVWSKDHPDHLDMTAINEFAQGHSWANKAAIRQSFKHTPFQSGRLITPFQNLPSRDYKVRINTLINGNPITEVDCNANHLRLFLAFNQTDVIGEDAYAPIVELSKVDRKKVKAFINVALNCDTFEAAKRAVAFEFHVSHEDAKRIDKAFTTLYPHIKLFGNFSLTAMQLEGMILKKVMLQGVTDNVLALPIHDAIAVESHNADWAEETLRQYWLEVTTKYHLGCSISLKQTNAIAG